MVFQVDTPLAAEWNYYYTGSLPTNKVHFPDILASSLILPTSVTRINLLLKITFLYVWELASSCTVAFYEDHPLYDIAVALFLLIYILCDIYVKVS